MRKVWKAIFATLIVVVLIVLLGLSVIFGNTYEMYAYVSDVNPDRNIVRFTSYLSEHDFWIEGVENWQLYDDAKLVMFSWFSTDYEDDQILCTDRIQLMKGAK